MTVDPGDEGGDPACWLHLFDDDADEGAGDAEGPAGDADAAPPPAEARGWSGGEPEGHGRAHG